MTSDSSAAGNNFSHRSSLPWSRVVRGGGEPDPTTPRSPSVTTDQNLGYSDQLTVTEPQMAAAAAVENRPERSEGINNENNDNESGVKRSVWSKPLANGDVEGSSTPVMGAASWPALSELTRPLPKSLSFQSEPSSKSASDGSVTIFQAPVISQVQQKPGKTNTNQHSNQNHSHRQRPMKRGGGGAGFSRLPPTPPPMPPYSLYATPYGGFVPPILDSPVREQTPYVPYNGNSIVPMRPVAGIGPPSLPLHDHPINRKRNNFGPRPRGDGGRRDHHDREWYGPRSQGGVMPHLGVAPPPPPLPRSYMQQAHLGAASYIAPPPVRSYGVPIGYEMPTPPPLVYVPPLHPRGSPSPTDLPSLPGLILYQIEYYFSHANLVKDHYLRLNMDEEGWVPLTLIAGFHRVKSLTSDLQLVLNSIRDSTIVEVQGETVRRRNDWRKWVKPSINVPPDSSSQSPHTITDGSVIEPSLQKLSLDESATTKERTIDPGLTDSIKLDNGEVTTGDESMNPSSSSQDI